MLKNLIILFVLCGLGVGGWEAYKHFAPDEKKVMWVVEDAVDSFNDMKLSGCLRALGANWTNGGLKNEDDEAFTVDKNTLRTALQALFLKKIDAENKFFYQCEISDEGFTVTAGSETSASAAFDLLLRVREGHKWSKSPAWHVRVSAEFGKEGDRWVITRSSLSHRSGQWPSF